MTTVNDKLTTHVDLGPLLDVHEQVAMVEVTDNFPPCVFSIGENYGRMFYQYLVEDRMVRVFSVKSPHPPKQRGIYLEFYVWDKHPDYVLVHVEDFPELANILAASAVVTFLEGKWGTAVEAAVKMLKEIRKDEEN